MSSLCRCAAVIIAKPIAVATKPHGGKMLALIQRSRPAHCGWRPTLCREFSIHRTSIERHPELLLALIREFQGRSADRQRGAESQDEPDYLGRPTMTSFRQFEANRRNARKSTGPTTKEGKQRSRCNAVRHGLTAETVIGALEDAEDYKAFEGAIIADYDAQSLWSANWCCD
jgi:hypothetical protein